MANASNIKNLMNRGIELSLDGYAEGDLVEIEFPNDSCFTATVFSEEQILVVEVVGTEISMCKSHGSGSKYKATISKGTTASKLTFGIDSAALKKILLDYSKSSSALKVNKSATKYTNLTADEYPLGEIKIFKTLVVPGTEVDTINAGTINCNNLNVNRIHIGSWTITKSESSITITR